MFCSPPVPAVRAAPAVVAPTVVTRAIVSVNAISFLILPPFESTIYEAAKPGG
jgi:hypothetical protein